MKDALILDTLKLVAPLRFDRAKFVDVLGRRLADLESEKKRPHAHIRHPKNAEELATRQLNEDLTEILRGKVPRCYGELPEYLGRYRRLCPHTSSYNQVRAVSSSSCDDDSEEETGAVVLVCVCVADAFIGCRVVVAARQAQEELRAHGAQGGVSVSVSEQSRSC